jgi:hypothetical protein
LRVTLDASSIPTVTVIGRVTNLITTRGVRVVLWSPLSGGQETSVNSDGSFVFSKVLPGTYVARVSLSGLPVTRQFSVTDHDVTDLIIDYPREFVVATHVLVEGGSAEAAPSIVVDAKNTKTGASRTALSISNLAMLSVNDGEYNVSVRNLPEGYQLKSMMYGTTDLQKTPLKIDGPVTWEIVVRLMSVAR